MPTKQPAHALNTTRTEIPPVCLWHASASLDGPGPVEACCAEWLDSEERRRVARFRQATSRNQCVIGRGMARRLLAGDQVRPAAVEFELLPHGKPVVRGPATARRPFNVSHTDGLVICGIGSDPDQWIGVDVEQLSRDTEPALAERYFSAPEVDCLRRTRSERQRRELFLKIWTLKESFIKALGTGLYTPLADFAFVELDSQRPRIELLRPGLDHQRDWQFVCLQPRPGYVAAVAVGTTERQSQPIELRCFEELLD